jgi:hypothetical protein
MTSVPTLLHLSLLGTTRQALLALVPTQEPLTVSSVPCPDLKSIRIFPKRRKSDLVNVLWERSKHALRFGEWHCFDLMAAGFMYSFK